MLVEMSFKDMLKSLESGSNVFVIKQEGEQMLLVNLNDILKDERFLVDVEKPVENAAQKKKAGRPPKKKQTEESP